MPRTATFTGRARNFKRPLQHSADPLGTVPSEQQINELRVAIGEGAFRQPQRLQPGPLQLPGTAARTARRRLIQNVLADMAPDRVPSRPHRKERRALKRRYKVVPYLTHPRPRHGPCPTTMAFNNSN
jgi:hypothetical protein